MDKLNALLEQYQNLQKQLEQACDEFVGEGSNEISDAVGDVEDAVCALQRAVEYAEGSELTKV